MSTDFNFITNAAIYNCDFASKQVLVPIQALALEPLM